MQCIGVDVNPEAISLASVNAKLLHLDHRIKFLNTALADNGFEGVAASELEHKFDLIVSNPPYIPTEDLEGLDPEILQLNPISWLHINTFTNVNLIHNRYEDFRALDGGPDGGTKVIEMIIAHSPTWLRCYFFLNIYRCF